MEERDEMYCTLCNGRGLDRYDRLCRKCLGTGFEPDTVDSRRQLVLAPRVKYAHDERR